MTADFLLDLLCDCGASMRTMREVGEKRNRAGMCVVLICTDICLINVTVTALHLFFPTAFSLHLLHTHTDTNGRSAVVFPRDNHG